MAWCPTSICMHQSSLCSPVRPRVALDKEPFFQLSGLGSSLLLGIGSMRVVEAHGSILPGRQAVLSVACSRAERESRP